MSKKGRTVNQRAPRNPQVKHTSPWRLLSPH